MQSTMGFKKSFISNQSPPEYNCFYLGQYVAEQIPLQLEAVTKSVFSELGIHSTLGQSVNRDGGKQTGRRKGGGEIEKMHLLRD